MKAIVVGSAGQDGSLLFERLVAEGWEVVGIERTGLRSGGARPVVAAGRITLGHRDQVRELVRGFPSDRIFYLAARHHSSEEKPETDQGRLVRSMIEVHLTGLIDFLDAIRDHAPNCHLVYAASSHVFGKPETPMQTEWTPMNPSSLYGITKAAGVQVCRVYRAEGVRASAAILYNHESARRREHFVSQRIVQGAKRARDAAARGERLSLRLGRLDAIVDWGFAPDYVDAMVRIGAQPEGDDYIVATGVPHTVRDFARIAFSAVGLNWQDYVEEEPGLLRGPLPVLIGDASKIRQRVGWQPSVAFEQMVEAMVRG